MNKKTLRDVDLAGKRVVMRVDFNVPMKDGVIKDDTRIQGALGSIKYVLDHGGSLVLMSHLGRPKGKGYEPEFSLKPVAEYLAKCLGKPVAFAPDCLKAADQAAALKPGEVLMLENTRFYKEETAKVKKTDDMTDEQVKAAKAELKAKCEEMAKTLASYGDIYCNDAFGAAHRAHASTAVIAKYAPVAVSGFLLEKEIQYLGSAVENPVRPFVAILGGAKVSDKLAVVKNLLTKVDTLIIGGGMAYTFLKAQGKQIGKSLCEDDQLGYANDMLALAKERGVKFLLPVDSVAADKFDAEANTQIVTEVPEGWMGLDIGPESVKLFAEALQGAKTVVWNGPMGCFEMPAFAKGTFGVCEAVAQVKANGGSTGGGASLEYLEGKVLPGVAALSDK